MKVALRVLFICLAQLVIFETVEQVSIHSRESTNELCQMGLLVLTFFALIWAVAPSFRGMRLVPARIACRATLAVVAFIGLYAVVYFYSWEVRPVLGINRQPDWAVQQREAVEELGARAQ